ncbi:MAG: ferrichrome ABC transporter permease, partial [Planctomycetes bacterium]|nr:ferrichrome ABC transporter permease [Planctomycetota bacterium]
MIRYALTIFLSAFLLFQVQPLIAKFILPWFGGTPAVWTTCMLFFQMTLLVGYAYAHLTSSWLTPRTQAIVHSVLLAVSLYFLPIIPNEQWKPTDGDLPAVRIILLLAATVGIPYLLLSTTGPLLQKWFSRTHPGTSPYRLYSLSNVGSLLALISYPFVFEPAMRLGLQAYLWSYGFGLFTVLCGLCVWLAFPRKDLEPVSIASMENTAATAASSAQTKPASIEPPSRFRILMWLGLAMVPSVMLL